MFLYINVPFLPNFSMGFLNAHVQSCMRVFTVLAAAVSTIFYTLGALVNRKLGQSSTNLKYRLMHL